MTGNLQQDTTKELNDVCEVFLGFERLKKQREMSYKAMNDFSIRNKSSQCYEGKRILPEQEHQKASVG